MYKIYTHTLNKTSTTRVSVRTTLFLFSSDGLGGEGLSLQSEGRGCEEYRLRLSAVQWAMSA